MNGNPVILPPGACRTDEHTLHRRLFLKGLIPGGNEFVCSSDTDSLR